MNNQTTTQTAETKGFTLFPTHREYKAASENNKFIAKGLQFAITPRQYAQIRLALGLERANEISNALFGCDLIWLSKQTAKWMLIDIEEGNIN